jgi:O-glycosyl hydrolase
VIFQGRLKNETDSEGEDSPQSQAVKEEKTEEKPKSKLTAKEVPIPDSDPESEQSDDPKKKKKVSARPAIRPEHFVMESDSSATSWMELSEKRKGRPSKK